MRPDRDEEQPAPGMPRREPLPGTQPKAPHEDPQAPAKVRRIISGPAYVRADYDAALLQRDELRATRLALEYTKAELALTEHDIASTIVLFGGTRIVEPMAAERGLQEMESCALHAPHDPHIIRRLQIARRILAKSRYYEIAREFAGLVSSICKGCPREFVIMTGGGPGIMEAGNRGARDAGAPSVGLNIVLPMEQYPNPYVTPDLCFRFRYFALRKFHFMKRAKALVAFPGGYGTLDELFDALCLVQTRKIPPMPIVLVGRQFWSHVFDPRYLADEGVIADEDLKLLSYAESASEIWDAIRAYYGDWKPNG
jgi:uncharacterized protein (TIGR00730 family)